MIRYLLLFQIEFEEGDKRNPINFSRRKKWAITAVACFGTFIVCKGSLSSFFFKFIGKKGTDNITNSHGLFNL